MRFIVVILFFVLLPFYLLDAFVLPAVLEMKDIYANADDITETVVSNR